jgi:hypothetical protein
VVLDLTTKILAKALFIAERAARERMTQQDAARLWDRVADAVHESWLEYADTMLVLLETLVNRPELLEEGFEIPIWIPAIQPEPPLVDPADPRLG